LSVPYYMILFYFLPFLVKVFRIHVHYCIA
jgi:hypothetical protein